MHPLVSCINILAINSHTGYQNRTFIGYCFTPVIGKYNSISWDVPWLQNKATFGHICLPALGHLREGFHQALNCLNTLYGTVTHCANVTLHFTALIVCRGETALERRGKGNPHTVALPDCYQQDKA